MQHDAETFDRYDSADYNNTFDDVAFYLEAVIDDGEDDPRIISQMLGTIARALGLRFIGYLFASRWLVAMTKLLFRTLQPFSRERFSR